VARILAACLGLLLAAAMPAAAERTAPYTYSGENTVDLRSGGTSFLLDPRDRLEVREIRIAWRFTVLVGEPLKEFAGLYSLSSPETRGAFLAGARSCVEMMPARATDHLGVRVTAAEVGGEAMASAEMLSTSRFRMVLATPPGMTLGIDHGGGPAFLFLDFSPDTLELDSGSGYGLSVAGSPNWDRMFQIGTRGLAGESSPWLDAETAKEVFRRGIEVARIELIEERYDLALVRAVYDRRLREACGAEEEEEATAEADEERPDAAARLRQMLAGVTGRGGIDAAPSAPGGGDEAATGLAERLQAAGNRAAEQRRAVAAGAEAAADQAERSRVLAAWETARESCEQSGPARPPPPHVPLRLLRSSDCDDACWHAWMEHDRQEREQAQRRHREDMLYYEQDRARWEQNALPACLAAADRERDGALAALDQAQQRRETLRETVLPSLADRLREAADGAGR